MYARAKKFKKLCECCSQGGTWLILSVREQTVAVAVEPQLLRGFVTVCLLRPPAPAHSCSARRLTNPLTHHPHGCCIPIGSNQFDFFSGGVMAPPRTSS